jgi:transcriptional regulator with XRE-family HTH domain
VGSGVRVGERLRAIRRQKGLSLHDVEARSGMEFKASVLGAYERGERAISVPRLLRLADIYDVPSDQLLPRLIEAEIDLDDETDVSAVDLMTRGFTIHLQRLHDLDEPETAILSRYATSIQLERQDFNGRLLTIRRDDLRVLAAVLGRTVDELGKRFVALGLCADVKQR